MEPFVLCINAIILRPDVYNLYERGGFPPFPTVKTGTAELINSRRTKEESIYDHGFDASELLQTTERFISVAAAGFTHLQSFPDVFITSTISVVLL